MKAKSETIKSFVALVETQFNKTVKSIRSDNGPEFLLNNWYNSKGIIHQRSCVETPQQNGIVERKHQHILSTTRALMFQSNVPKSFWNHVVSHAVFLINRQPSDFLLGLSPFQVLHRKAPSNSDLKVFGCLCYSTTLTAKRQKLDSRARKGVFLGYKSGVKGSIIYDLKTREIFISRDVLYYENQFPFRAKLSPSVGEESPQPKHVIYDDPLDYSPIYVDDAGIPEDHDQGDPNQMSTIEQDLEDSGPLFETEEVRSVSDDEDVIPLRKPSQRTRKAPGYLADYHCNLIYQPTKSKTSNAKYPISKALSYNKLSESHKHFSLCVYFSDK
jgi:hypothetical protein